ncbi:hypothetical protein [Parachryseolinea silvisoli]|uniref:hypothetical protein n=1 Tax=Parachryseolinea silvisoli TaxID=2873601 RepID=UPI00226593B1|nr:hypothetical protein [Parachryseolinea silvisoli]MCD9016443.1 hypothetical protein [Parachryseolinea silvisoli]
MEKFRTKLVMVALSVLSLSFALSSCSDDDEATPTYGDPSVATFIGGVTSEGKIPLTIAVTAPAGLKNVTLGETEIKSYSNGETSDVFQYLYEGDATSLALVVTDVNGNTGEKTESIVPVVVVDANITANTTWEKSKRYLLKANIFVTNNATLTIQPGTIIFGDKTSKGALIIERGAKLMAAGTAAEPIVFTSSSPAGFRNTGDWGGLVLLGKAKNNQNANQNIEGVTAGALGQYGGEVADDNSGTITYVRVEFAGIALSTDNEINGITLGSVGSETTFHHVQVSYSGDDAFEWFGGTVNATHLIAYKTWDDDFDTDFGFTGKVQYAAAFREPNTADKSGSNIFESDNDGNGNPSEPFTAPVFANVTGFGPFVYAKLGGTAQAPALNNGAVSANFQNGLHVRRRSQLKLYNSVILGAGTTGNAALRTTDSKNGASPDADFQSNYFGRYVGGLTLPATGANDLGFDVDAIPVDNNTADKSTIDLSAKFAGLTTVGDLNTPAATATLAANSPLATGAKDMSAEDEFFQKTDYIGAVGTSAGWLGESWVNFTPNTTNY